MPASHPGRRAQFRAGRPERRALRPKGEERRTMIVAVTLIPDPSDSGLFARRWLVEPGLVLTDEMHEAVHRTGARIYAGADSGAPAGATSRTRLRRENRCCTSSRYVQKTGVTYRVTSCENAS